MCGAMLERYHKLQPKPKTIAELKYALPQDMPQEPINKAVKDFTKRLKANQFLFLSLHSRPFYFTLNVLIPYIGEFCA